MFQLFQIIDSVLKCVVMNIFFATLSGDLFLTKYIVRCLELRKEKTPNYSKKINTLWVGVYDTT